MAEATVERLSRYLECAVCLEIYNSPKALPCQHTFCLACIHRTAKGNIIQCPSCKDFHKIPEGGPEHFLTNYTLLPMIDELRQIQPREAEQASEISVSSENIKSSTKCQTKQAGLAKLALDSLKEIQNRIDSFDLIINKIQDLQEMIVSAATESKSQISADVRNLIKCLQERERELNDDVSLHAHSERERLQSLKCEVATYARELRQSCDHKRNEIEKCQEISNEEWKKLLKDGDQSLQNIALISKRFEKVQFEVMEYCNDSEQKEQADVFIKQYGELFVQTKSQQLLYQRSRFHSCPMTPRSPQDVSRVSTISVRSKTLPLNATQDIKSISFSPSCSDDFRYRSLSSCSPDGKLNAKAKKITEKRQCTKESSVTKQTDANHANHSCEPIGLNSRLQSTGRMSPSSVTSTPLPSTASHPFSRNSSRHRIHEFNKSIEGSALDPLYPLGIAELSNGTFAIASGSTLRIFNSRGVESTPRAPLRIKKARVLADVCCLPNGTIIATDSFNNEILQYSSIGRPRGCFTMEFRGRKLDKPTKPYGITCDQRGFLFICDRENKCVLVCRPNGVVDKVIGSNRLKDPLYVALNTTETVIYVSDCQSSAIVVFTLDGDFVKLIQRAKSASPIAPRRRSSSTPAKFSRLSGVAITPDNSLLMCDSEYNTVAILNPTTGVLKALISIDQSSTESDLDNRMHMDRPMGITFLHSTNAVAVCDTNNNRVLVFKWEKVTLKVTNH